MGEIPIGTLIIAKGNMGDDEYHDDWGNRTHDVLFAWGGNGHPIDLDWGDFGNYGTDSEVGQYLQNNEETQGCEDLRNQSDVGSLEFLPTIKSYATERKNSHEPLNNSKAKSAGSANCATVLRRRRQISNRKVTESNRSKKSKRA